MTIEYKIGDCLTLMEELPSNSIDMILTDPPFNVGIDYGTTTDDNKSDNEYSDWFFIRLEQMERIIKEGKPIIVFSGDKRIYPVMNAVQKSNLQFHHFIKWNKPGCQRALSGFVLFNRTELAFLLTKGKPEQSILNRKALYSDTLTYKNTSSKGQDDTFSVDHPCRRPSQLYAHLIKGFTKGGDSILDPFVGSGTTLLACRITDRNGIGFEINPEYESKIKERMGSKSPQLESWGGQ